MKKAGKSNIESIVNNALCSACGGCAGICPVGAISIQENPAGFQNASLNTEKCVSCGKCLEICPSNGSRSCDDLYGNIQNGFLSYAKDANARKNGQSGGVVTAILKWMLEEHYVDAVVVTRFNTDKNRAEAYLASSILELNDSFGSHYTQTSPVEIILKNQDKKLAAVLLGCQTACLNRIKEKYPKYKLPILTIGLICGGNLSGFVADDILSQAKFSKGTETTSFRFRDKSSGWPGDIVVTSREKRVQLPKELRMKLKPYYQNYRCMLCAEKMNQFADIVVGDPWEIKKEDEKLGYSAVLTRTVQGSRFIQLANQENIICSEAIPAQDIIDGQKIDSGLRKQLAQYNAIRKKHGWYSPYTESSVCSSDIIDAPVEKKLCYLRELHLTQNKETALKLIKKRKNELDNPVKELLYTLKKKIQR